MSKSALDRLGRRMAAVDQVADDDLRVFTALADTYQTVLDQVRTRLAELGFTATPRVKTTGTLVDKLKRQHTRLSQVQDLAGARFTVADRAAQDAAVQAIVADYESAGCVCKVDDLRDDPSHGYRAVHVILLVGQIPVEIQVRTEMQDAWAQLVENLGDRWGRGIRYGDDPAEPDALI
ncbi:MAG TPA: RelA/SpoT domain-containing protein [Streptosporangiaceae bacterium]|nr:RelA/SpoT domain-containing protein [Streptosporangiaceae bacterium]